MSKTTAELYAEFLGFRVEGAAFELSQAYLALRERGVGIGTALRECDYGLFREELERARGFEVDGTKHIWTHDKKRGHAIAYWLRIQKTLARPYGIRLSDLLVIQDAAKDYMHEGEFEKLADLKRNCDLLNLELTFPGEEESVLYASCVVQA